MNKTRIAPSTILQKILTIFYFILLFLTITSVKKAQAQDQPLRGYENGFVPQSRFYGDVNDMQRNVDLENRHKSALERGDMTEASDIETEMDSKTPGENFFPAKHNNGERFVRAQTDPVNDWVPLDNMIHNGQVKSLPSTTDRSI